MTIPLQLYSTTGCHLCEHAKALIFPLLDNSHFVFEEIDIADNDQLMERYGVTIPVLGSPRLKEELSWPFSSDEVAAFLERIPCISVVKPLSNNY